MMVWLYYDGIICANGLHGHRDIIPSVVNQVHDNSEPMISAASGTMMPLHVSPSPSWCSKLRLMNYKQDVPASSREWNNKELPLHQRRPQEGERSSMESGVPAHISKIEFPTYDGGSIPVSG